MDKETHSPVVNILSQGTNPLKNEPKKPIPEFDPGDHTSMLRAQLYFLRDSGLDEEAAHLEKFLNDNSAKGKLLRVWSRPVCVGDVLAVSVLGGVGYGLYIGGKWVYNRFFSNEAMPMIEPEMDQDIPI